MKPGAGTFGLVANRVSFGALTWPLALSAVRSRRPSWWQAWQVGCCSQPTRLGEPTWAIVEWQLWHCIAGRPSGPVALPITPRRHLVSAPGWHM